MPIGLPIYHLYGLNLQSNQTLITLPSLLRSSYIDIDFNVKEVTSDSLISGEHPHHQKVVDWLSATHERFWLQPESTSSPIYLCYRSELDGNIDFVIHQEGHHVQCHWTRPYTPEDIGVLLLSAVMLLRHVREEKAAGRLQSALEQVYIDATSLTPDVGGGATTSDFAKAVISKLN